MREMQANAAFGIDAVDAITAVTAGRVDPTKDIMFAIRKEYFTFSQTTHIFWLGMMLGVGAFATAVMVTDKEGVQITGEYGNQFIAIVLLSLGMASFFAVRATTRSAKKCSKDAEAEFKGRDCFTDWDCTRKSSLKGKKKGDKGLVGVCKRPEQSGIAKAYRKVVVPLALIGGAIFVTIEVRAAKKDSTLIPAHLATRASGMGIGIGAILMIFFS